MGIMAESCRDQREDDISEKGNVGKMGQKQNGTYYVDDNITVHGDVLMWDLDDIDVEHSHNLSDHLATSMNLTPTTYLQTKESKMVPKSPIAPKISVRLSPVDNEKAYPKRPIFSPSDAMETYRFRDLFPNPELKIEKTNSLGKTNAGGAYVIDDNITMHGDVMMLDLENESKVHSTHTYTAVEKFNQLAETPMNTTKPANRRAATTGIRHLMAIRNPELVELPNDNGINTEKKRKKKKKKSKHRKIKQESQSRKEILCRVDSPIQETVAISANTVKKPADFVQVIRSHLSRFRAYIYRKLICC